MSGHGSPLVKCSLGLSCNFLFISCPTRSTVYLLFFQGSVNGKHCIDLTVTQYSMAIFKARPFSDESWHWVFFCQIL